MNATSIFFGLLIVLFTILLLYWIRRLKPQSAGFSITKDVPVLRIDNLSPKPSLLGVWRRQFLKAVAVTVKQQSPPF